MTTPDRHERRVYFWTPIGSLPKAFEGLSEGTYRFSSVPGVVMQAVAGEELLKPGRVEWPDAVYAFAPNSGVGSSYPVMQFVRSRRRPFELTFLVERDIGEIDFLALQKLSPLQSDDIRLQKIQVDSFENRTGLVKVLINPFYGDDDPVADDSAALELRLSIPNGLAEDEVVDHIRKLAAAADEIHRARGGGGLILDSAEVDQLVEELVRQ